MDEISIITPEQESINPTVTSNSVPETTIPGSPKPPRFSKKKILIAVAAFLGLIGLICLILLYAVVAKGATLFGYSLPDRAWRKAIDERKVLAERSFSTKYIDSGTFSFTPSAAANAVGFPLEEQEAKEYDEKFAFTIKDIQVGVAANGFINVENEKQPKVDLSFSGLLGNQGKEYQGSVDIRLTDAFAYLRYDYNQAIADILAKIDNPESGQKKGKWIKAAKDSSEYESMKETFSTFNILAAKEKARDAKRIADIRQMASALELYFNDNNGYPAADSQNRPTGLTDLYLGQYPVAPTPADGKCSDDLNAYFYKPEGQPETKTLANGSKAELYPNYSLTFCLGNDSGGTKAGKKVLTLSGINDLAECPSGRQCDQVASKTSSEPDPYAEILKNNRIFNIKSFHGLARIDGVTTLHYSLDLDKSKVKNIFKETLKLDMQSAGFEATEEDKKLQAMSEKLFDAYLDKLETKQFEVWIGLFDRKVYKATLNTNGPSVAKIADRVYQDLIKGDLQKMLGVGIEEASNKSRDAKRAADMRQISSALELYYNDYGGYPAADGNKPAGLNPEYISDIPVEPSETDGRCNEYYNTYWYSPVGSSRTVNGPAGKKITVYDDYNYTFCLGSQTGGLESGVLVLTRNGINPLEKCKSDPSCYQSGTTDNDIEQENPEDKMLNYMVSLIRDLPFDAVINSEIKAKNFGQDRKIEEPQDAIAE